MKNSNIVIFLLITSFKIGFSQYEFKNETEWKEAHEMIYQANLGNCDLACGMFDTMRRDTSFKHGLSYIAIANCLQKNGKDEEANQLIQYAKDQNILGQSINEDSISHPELKEKFLIMYLEDQGSWTLDDRFIIDPEAKGSIERTGIDLNKLITKLRRLPGRELHKLHVIEMEKIISTHGFPTYEMIGYHAMKGVKLVILHSKLDILEKYSEDFQKHFGMKRLAYLIDKMRVAKKEKQIYGTQGDFDENSELIFYPIEDEENVNERRRAADMSPIEIYAKILGVKNYTLLMKD